MENGAVNHEMETTSTITIKGILSVLMQNVDENNCKRLISLGMGDPTVYSCFHTFHVAGETVVEALQSDKFNGYSPTVGLPQTRSRNGDNTKRARDRGLEFPNPSDMKETGMLRSWKISYLTLSNIFERHEGMKKELMSSFFPENVDYIARKKLRDLVHIGSIREYVREFAALLLDIRDMSEKDKMFAFLEGLKQWARTEVMRHRPEDITAAMAAAKRLTDYNDNSTKRKSVGPGGSNNSVGNGNKAPRNDRPASWGPGRRVFSREQSQNRGNGGPGQGNGQGRFPLGCFLCKGPHKVAECPQRGAINALEVSPVGGTPQASGTENSAAEPSQVGSICFLTALQSQLSSLKKEPEKGLMYVNVIINWKASWALVDTGATDTFISPTEARRCGLVVAKGVGQMKAVNSVASSICGNSKEVRIKLGPLEGNVNFTVTPMDDFDVVLGLDFMTSAQAIPVPAAGCLMLLGDCPCVAPVTVVPRGGKKMLSAIQFKKGIKKGKPSFLVLPVCKEDSPVRALPRGIQRVLEDYKDVMPDKLPQEQLRFLWNRDRRLVRKYEGPLPIVAKVGNSSYRIKPPTWMKVHPVFYVSNLKPFHADPSDASRGLSDKEPICVKPPSQRRVEEILADKFVTVSKKKPVWEYLVKWEGLGPEESSWERDHDLKAFQQKIEEFLATQSTRTSTS
ncbi:hypothetical protein HRI_003124600 [Hibiscus trionum]|uniref:Chromo domain-containing protein n=1 Tax=Hibiscus trionum TaxID=183268 RepID=A0A9W7IHX9_HIBTR|nr:hypothetical protein HRI_003124600 [Hibiscus trionum]